jgi:hypothetical protein
MCTLFHVPCCSAFQAKSSSPTGPILLLLSDPHSLSLCGLTGWQVCQALSAARDLPRRLAAQKQMHTHTDTTCVTGSRPTWQPLRCHGSRITSASCLVLGGSNGRECLHIAGSLRDTCARQASTVPCTSPTSPQACSHGAHAVGAAILHAPHTFTSSCAHTRGIHCAPCRKHSRHVTHLGGRSTPMQHWHAALCCAACKAPCDPQRPLCNPVQSSATLCEPLRRPAQAQPRHGSARGPARARRTERGAYGGARRAQEGVRLELGAQPARHRRLALDATSGSQAQTRTMPAALRQGPGATTEPAGERLALRSSLCTSAEARGIRPQARRARVLGLAAAGPGACSSLHAREGRARRAPRLRPQLLDLRRARGERGVVGVDPRGKLGVALRVLVTAEDPRAGRQLAQLRQRLRPAPRASGAANAAPCWHGLGQRQPSAAQLGPRPPGQHHRSTTRLHACTSAPASLSAVLVGRHGRLVPSRGTASRRRQQARTRHICSGVPSNRRPQPSAKSVSPAQAAVTLDSKRAQDVYAYERTSALRA